MKDLRVRARPDEFLKKETLTCAPSHAHTHTHTLKLGKSFYKGSSPPTELLVAAPTAGNSHVAAQLAKAAQVVRLVANMAEAARL